MLIRRHLLVKRGNWSQCFVSICLPWTLSAKDRSRMQSFCELTLGISQRSGLLYLYASPHYLVKNPFITFHFYVSQRFSTDLNFLDIGLTELSIDQWCGPMQRCRTTALISFFCCFFFLFYGISPILIVTFSSPIPKL